MGQWMCEWLVWAHGQDHSYPTMLPHMRCFTFVLRKRHSLLGLLCPSMGVWGFRRHHKIRFGRAKRLLQVQTQFQVQMN